jgi:hypothetical protein
MDSPIIIDDLGDVAVEISIRTKGIYLVFRNLVISKLSIIDSENIIFENCFINDLEISVCRNLTFNNSTIITIRQFLCRNCVFENNSILQKEYSKLVNNSYERRTIVYIWICLTVGILYEVFSVSSLVYLYISLDSIVFLISGVLLSIAMIYLLKLRYSANKLPQNSYLNFSIQDEGKFYEKHSVKIA